ncbi:hypothetical protein OEA41_001857 [Lepraria neglecta]|uniref:DUF4385 multi-domain protein n=1 Tax=Lepraria neglecta TaxID=209136 RepID=A0AAD9ZBH4_9LECA|nr:hypothetical protein OEA41_001857 [Lepraria neglecta]
MGNLQDWTRRNRPRTSSAALWDAFLTYEREDDFVGMDMCRKFIQMGMTRARRYANHKNGRKYGADGNVIEFGEAEDWEGRKEKEEASMIFREVWERARNHEGYQMKKKEFLKEQKEWDKDQTRKEAPEEKGKKRKRKEEDEEK